MGFIETPKYICYLYDPDNPDSVRPKKQASEKQIAALQKGRTEQKRKANYRRWYRHEGFIEEDRSEVVRWVQKIIQQDWVILDCETTGLGDAEVVEIAVIDSQKQTLLNTLVRPSVPIPTEATAIHGITDEMVADAPTFPEIYSKLKEVLLFKIILIYNDEADRNFIHYCCKLYNLPKIKFKDRTYCLLNWYAQWYGEFSEYWKGYKWQPLCGGHRALNDCLRAYDYLMEIAQDDPNFNVPSDLQPCKQESEPSNSVRN